MRLRARDPQTQHLDLVRKKLVELSGESARLDSNALLGKRTSGQIYNQSSLQKQSLALRENKWLWMSFQGLIVFGHDREGGEQRQVHGQFGDHKQQSSLEESKGLQGKNNNLVSSLPQPNLNYCQLGREMAPEWPEMIPYANCNPRHSLVDPSKSARNKVKCRLKVRLEREILFDDTNQRWNWYKSWNLPTIKVNFYVSSTHVTSSFSHLCVID